MRGKALEKRGNETKWKLSRKIGFETEKTDKREKNLKIKIEIEKTEKENKQLK